MKIVHFRLYLNPWGWSFVINLSVNISLISVLLFSIVISVLSDEWLDLEFWYWLMIENAEAATNIKRQESDRGSEEESERGSEEANKQSCSCMRIFLDIPVVRIVLTVLLGLWPAGNIQQTR